MLFFTIVLAFALHARAQDNSTSDPTAFFSTLAQTFQSSGLTALAGVAPRLNNTALGQSVIGRLADGANYTFFAPSNDAFLGAPAALANDDELLARILSYHVVSGNFSLSNGTLESDAFPNVSVGRTLLNDTKAVRLEGNKSQVLAWSSINGKVQFLNQRMNVTVENASSVDNLFINVIDGILRYPLNVSTTLERRNLTSLSGLLNTTVDSNNETLASIFNSDARGFTFFAPNNRAIMAASSSLTSLAGNSTAITTLLANHIVNGTTIYSSSLSPSVSLTSAAGQPLAFSTNSSGTFITSSADGSIVATARLVSTDVLVDNGVIHIIDGVLFNLDTNAEAASSAYGSATSAAGVGATSTETGPVGGETSTSGSNNHGANNNGAQGIMGIHERVKSLVATLVGTLGWTALGVAIL